jgi:hypothetical protein
MGPSVLRLESEPPPLPLIVAVVFAVAATIVFLTLIV